MLDVTDVIALGAAKRIRMGLASKPFEGGGQNRLLRLRRGMTYNAQGNTSPPLSYHVFPDNAESALV